MPYLPNTPQDRDAMLQAIGARSIEDLLADIPETVRLKRALDLPPALSEMELVKFMNELAANIGGDPKTRARVRFAISQWVDAAAPSNFLAFNPKDLFLIH